MAGLWGLDLQNPENWHDLSQRCVCPTLLRHRALTHVTGVGLFSQVISVLRALKIFGFLFILLGGH